MSPQIMKKIAIVLVILFLVGLVHFVLHDDFERALVETRAEHL